MIISLKVFFVDLLFALLCSQNDRYHRVVAFYLPLSDRVMRQVLLVPRHAPLRVQTVVLHERGVAVGVVGVTFVPNLRGAVGWSVPLV